MKNTIILLIISVALVSCDEKAVNDDCGDEVVDVGEDCDGLNFNGKFCQALGYYGGTLSCTDNCKFDEHDCIGSGFCGDGVFQGGNEFCDGDALNGETCVTKGFFDGDLACGEDCTFDTSSCNNCGNNIVDTGEDCDGDVAGETCLSLRYHGGVLSCTVQCLYDLTDCELFGMCGDGEIDYANDEECESSNLDGETCITMGYDSGELSCLDSCEMDTSGCASGCNVDGYYEVCDISVGAKECSCVIT
jgi:hypothetical protein